MIAPAVSPATAAWIRVVRAEAVLPDSGGAVLVDGLQIAIYRFSNPERWYACQNQCPHKGDMVLGRGLIGDEKGEPKVACPMHKKAFSLASGQCLGGEEYRIDRYPIKVEDGFVHIRLEPLP